MPKSNTVARRQLATLAFATLTTQAKAQNGPTMTAQAKTLAPTGPLRAAINFGNPVLAQRAPDGTPQGVSVALSTELAKRLGIPLAIIPFDQAGKVTEALPDNLWDICFLAQDPVRGQGIAFTAPYVLIEGVYAVRNAAPFKAIDDIDNDGVTVGVVQGSAYDLYLTRALKRAVLSRYRSNKDAAHALVAGTVPVLAGVKQPLAALVAANPGHRLIPGRFMSIEQTMGTPNTRPPEALAALQAFIAEMKTSGFVAQALAATGQQDAQVAP